MNDPTAADSGAAVLDGVDAVRSTARWLIGAFAAIGVTIVAGSQLSNIGSLRDHPGRLMLALLGVAVALAGVALAIQRTAAVLLPGAVDLGEIVKREASSTIGKMVANDPALLEGHGSSIASVHSAYLTALGSYEAAWRAYEASNATGDAAQAARDLADAERLATERDAIGETLQHLRNLALFVAVRDAFTRSAKYLVGGAAFAAAGITLFAFETHPPATKAARGRVTVHAEIVSPRCDVRAAEALAHSAGAVKGYRVVVLPGGTCRPHPVTLEVASADAAVVDPDTR